MADVLVTQKPVVPIDASTQFVATKEINGTREIVQIDADDLRGLDGVSAIAIITNASPAAIPAVGQQVQYEVDASDGLAIDQVVAIGSASSLKVAGLPTSTSIVLENIDATPGGVASGAKIVPSGRKGTNGLNSTVPGPSGANAFATVTNQFAIPSVNSNVIVDVNSTSFMSNGMALQISGKFFRVASISSPTQIVLENSLASQSGTILAASTVVAAGSPGTDGINGISAIASTTGTPPNIPNYNSTADYLVDSSGGLASGQYYGFESISGVLWLASKAGNTITLKNISVAPTTVVASGTKLVPVGKPGAASFAITTNPTNTTVPAIGLNFSLSFEDTSSFPLQGAIAIEGIPGVAIVVGKTGNLLTLQNDSISPDTIIQPARTAFIAGRRGADANISSAAAILLGEAVAPITIATQMALYVDPADKRLKKREQSNGVSSLLVGVIYAPTTTPPIGSTSYDWVATDIDEKHYWKPTGNAGAGIWVQYTG